MKNKTLSILVLSAVLGMGLISGCYYDEIIPDTSIYSGEQISFNVDIIPLFDSSCNASGCHNTGQVAPDLTAGNAYNSLINDGYVDVANPESSELYQWVKGNRTTPMPISGTDSKIVSSVLLWVEQGALDN